MGLSTVPNLILTTELWCQVHFTFPRVLQKKLASKWSAIMKYKLFRNGMCCLQKNHCNINGNSQCFLPAEWYQQGLMCLNLDLSSMTMGQIKQGPASKISHKCGIVSNILTNAIIWAFLEWVKERDENRHFLKLVSLLKPVFTVNAMIKIINWFE